MQRKGRRIIFKDKFDLAEYVLDTYDILHDGCRKHSDCDRGPCAFRAAGRGWTCAFANSNRRPGRILALVDSQLLTNAKRRQMVLDTMQWA